MSTPSHLPAPCEQCKEGDWLVVERNSVSGVLRCECPRGVALLTRRAQKEREDYRPNPRAIRVASQAAAALAAFGASYPFDDTARTMIAEEIALLCKSPAEARWLVRRMLRLYAKWPGVREMRIVYCSRFVPADGDDSNIVSQYYPDGIPAEIAMPVAAPVALPAGQAVSADPELDAAIRDAAKRKAMGRGGKRLVPYSRTLTGTEGV